MLGFDIGFSVLHTFPQRVRHVHARTFCYEVRRNSGKFISNLLFQFLSCSWFWLVVCHFGRPSPRERDHTENSRDLAKAIAFVLDDQSTDQENGCQVMHELEMQNMMVLHNVWSTVLHICSIEKQCRTWNCPTYSKSDISLVAVISYHTVT